MHDTDLRYCFWGDINSDFNIFLPNLIFFCVAINYISSDFVLHLCVFFMYIVYLFSVFQSFYTHPFL